MEASAKQSLIIPLMARMMVPFRRNVGYSFDTDAFLNDETYANIIVQAAMESSDANLQNLGKQIAHVMGQTQTSPGGTAPIFAHTSSGPATRAPVTRGSAPTQSSYRQTGTQQPTTAPTEADILRAELIRKYQGGIR